MTKRYVGGVGIRRSGEERNIIFRGGGIMVFGAIY